jgi:BTB/POZ domain
MVVYRAPPTPPMSDGAPCESRGDLRARAMLQRLFESGDGSDTQFVSAAGGRVFRLHRLILSQYSPVLTAMLSSAFKEASSCGSSPVVIGETSARTLAAFFAYMYGADLPPAAAADTAFFCEVWELAHRFEVAGLEDEARERTRARLPRQPLAAFSVLAVARGLRDKVMVGEVRAQLARDLELLARCALMVELSVEDMRAVLGLASRRERGKRVSLRAMFEASMRWIEADPDERASQADNLFLYLDLSTATMREVEAMVARPIANQSSVLMCKIVAGPLARELQERRQLEQEVQELRLSQSVKEQDQAHLVERVDALQTENAAIRQQVSIAATSERQSMEQLQSAQASNSRTGPARMLQDSSLPRNGGAEARRSYPWGRPGYTEEGFDFGSPFSRNTDSGPRWGGSSGAWSGEGPTGMRPEWSDNVLGPCERRFSSLSWDGFFL